MEREAHAPTNSALVFDPSLQLKNHLTSGASIIFKDPIAPHPVPPAVDAPSKNAKVYLFV